MSEETKIQWCDSTVNPIMGCAGCELFPLPKKVLDAVDKAVGEVVSDWTSGTARKLYKELIQRAYADIENPGKGHRSAVTTTNIWHLRDNFVDRTSDQYGKNAAKEAEATLAREITCYAATLHMNRGYNLMIPDRGVNIGHAPTFEQLTHFEGRVHEAGKLQDLLGKSDPDRPWIDGLPRLIFVSDMGDAFSRSKDFSFLKREVIEPVNSELGRRHLWLWLTKRPNLMREFAEEIGGFPDNVCAMTTLTGPDSESLQRLDDLRQVRASVRGLSVEPLWERIPPDKLNLEGIDWLILGGESGSPKKYSRPFAIEWVEELRDHCQKNGVAFFLKQLGRRPTIGGEVLHLRDRNGGDWSEWPDDSLRVREFPQAFHLYREGEVTAGGLRRVRTGGMIPSEVKEFKRLHKVVSKFAKDTVVAADALFQIRDHRLYRGKFKTFSDYCESVHEMSRQYANRLIKAGKIRAEMVPIVSKMELSELNEAQLRELGRLSSPEERVEVFREAIEQAKSNGEKLTAKLLADVTRQRKADDEEETGDEKLRMTASQRLVEARPLLTQLESLLAESGIGSDVLEELKRLLGE